MDAMPSKIAAIMQPTYLPWVGYFDLIDQVDVFVYLDDVQFEKQSWQQRNQLRGPGGLEWITVPVRIKGRFGQLICDVEINPVKFPDKHIKQVAQNYRRAPYFKDYFESFEAAIRKAADSGVLCGLNISMIEWCCQNLSIGTKRVRSSQLGVEGRRSERLVQLLDKLEADRYLSPMGSYEYICEDSECFDREMVKVSFLQYEHPEYKQVYDPFMPYASVIDLLFNHGPAAPGNPPVRQTPDGCPGRDGKMSTIEINGREIGPARPVYLIAEMSANHNQDFDRAVEIIRAMKDAGADAVKSQTYTADTLTLDSDAEPFQLKGTAYEGQTLYDLYKEAYTPWEWQPKLKEVANELGLDFFSTPFDPSSVDFLEKMDVPVYKIASSEVVDLPLIQKIAATGKPVIMSTGMADLGEIERAVSVIRRHGSGQVALLKCTASYPALPEEMNLKTIPNLAETFGLPVGLSDHTLGTEIAVASVALGATIIEKHFTLSREQEGPDSFFSLEPHEFKALADSVRMVEKAMGAVHYGPAGRETVSRKYRRSLFVALDVKAGELFTEQNVRSVRPGNGLDPALLPDILGKKARKDLAKGTPLAWEHIE